MTPDEFQRRDDVQLLDALKTLDASSATAGSGSST